MKQPPYTHEQLVKEAQFSTEDLDQIKQRRRDHNRLGFAAEQRPAITLQPLSPQEDPEQALTRGAVAVGKKA